MNELETCKVCGNDKVIGDSCWACDHIFAGEDGN